MLYNLLQKAEWMLYIYIYIYYREGWDDNILEEIVY